MSIVTDISQTTGYYTSDIHSEWCNGPYWARRFDALSDVPNMLWSQLSFPLCWSQVSREAAAPPGLRRTCVQWWRTIAIIRDHRPPSLHATYSNSATTMRVRFKVNKLSLMPNLRRPANNASSRNYLNACNCVRYDLFAVPSHCLTRYMRRNYSVSITADSRDSIRTIDRAIKHSF